MKILVLGSPAYSEPFIHIGDITYDPHDIFNCDAVLFTGGHDVTPALYGEEQHPQTQNYQDRDIGEAGYFAIAQRRGIPMFGICRGSQFLCAMSGGTLHQHIHGHAIGGTHEIVTSEKSVVEVTSTHHQMMDLSQLPHTNYKLLAYAPMIAGLEEEPEAVEFYNTKALAVQFHPEYMDKYSDGWGYYQRLVHNHLTEYCAKYRFKQLEVAGLVEEVEDLVAEDSLGLRG